MPEHRDEGPAPRWEETWPPGNSLNTKAERQSSVSQPWSFTDGKTASAFAVACGSLCISVLEDRTGS